MKTLGFALGITLTVLFCTPSIGADFNDEDYHQELSQSAAADPVSELRNQDAAFSLLMEAYRQVQGYMIESDYETRLQAAESLSDLKERRRVLALARQERDLRLKKLFGQLDNLHTTYRHARQLDEREAGVEVPIQVDTVAAAHALKSYVFLVADAGRESIKAVPASLYMADVAPPPDGSVLDEHFHELFVNARGHGPGLAGADLLTIHLHDR